MTTNPPSAQNPAMQMLRGVIQKAFKAQLDPIKQNVDAIFQLLSKMKAEGTLRTKEFFPKAPTFPEKVGKKTILQSEHLHSLAQWMRKMHLFEATKLKAIIQAVQQNTSQIELLQNPTRPSVDVSDTFGKDVVDVLERALQEAKKQGEIQAREKKVETEREKLYLDENGVSQVLTRLEALMQINTQELKREAGKLRAWRRVMVKFHELVKGPYFEAIRIIPIEDLKQICDSEPNIGDLIQGLTERDASDYLSLPEIAVHALFALSEDDLETLCLLSDSKQFKAPLSNLKPKIEQNRKRSFKLDNGIVEKFFQARNTLLRVREKKDVILFYRELNPQTRNYLRTTETKKVGSLIKTIKQLKKVKFLCDKYNPHSEDAMNELAGVVESEKFKLLWKSLRTLDETYKQIENQLLEVEKGIQERSIEGIKNQTYRLREYMLRKYPKGSDILEITAKLTNFLEVVNEEFQVGTKACNDYLAALKEAKSTLDTEYQNAIKQLAMVKYALENKCVPYSNSSFSIGAWSWGGYIKGMLKNLRDLKKEVSERVDFSGSEGSLSGGQSVSGKNSDSGSRGGPSSSSGNSSTETSPTQTLSYKKNTEDSES